MRNNPKNIMDDKPDFIKEKTWGLLKSIEEAGTVYISIVDSIKDEINREFWVDYISNEDPWQ